VTEGIGTDTLTVKEVARKLGLSLTTVYSMVRENRFPVRPLPLPQRKLLFSRAAIDRFVEAGR
jgi:excisionase family DNA binding protein